jgi:hypothetical protein
LPRKSKVTAARAGDLGPDSSGRRYLELQSSITSGYGAEGSSQTITVELDGEDSRPPGSSILSENVDALENVDVAALDAGAPVDAEAALELPNVPVVFCDVDCCAC